MTKMKINKINTMRITLSTLLVFWFSISYAQKTETFQWPDGNTMAVSLTWDDGRKSQVEVGTPILDQHGVKATFYVVPSAVEQALEGWKLAVNNGHEIGNHSLVHPCSGNFLWARDNALEEYTLTQMNTELQKANEKTQELLGVQPTVFAYPCGQTYVGRGINTKSYVPIISEQFTSGRTWLDEAANDPAYCDMAQLTGMEMDGKDFQEMKILIELAQKNGSWLILAGHDIGDKNAQTTEVEMLKKLLPYLTDPANKIWVATVGEISEYIKANRNL